MRKASSISITMGIRLAQLRAARRLSLQDVADRAKISKSHMWELEQGRSRNPSIETAVALSRALGVSLDYLIGLRSTEPDMHPEALRIAGEIDALLRRHVPQDVAKLVVAARVAANEDQSDDALRRLDQASEAFADRVPWSEEPRP